MGLFGKKTAIGLDIGSGFVKIVEVDRSGDQPEVSRVAMRPLLPDAIVEGEVMDPGLVGSYPFDDLSILASLRHLSWIGGVRRTGYKWGETSRSRNAFS